MGACWAAMEASVAALPTSWPASSERSQRTSSRSQYACTGSMSLAQVATSWATTGSKISSIQRAPSARVEDPPAAALLGVPGAGPAHARPGRHVVEQDGRLALAGLDAGQLAQPARVVVAAGHGDAQAQLVRVVLAGLEDDLVDDVAQLVDGLQAAIDAVALVALDADVRVQRPPRGPRSGRAG